MNYPKSYIFYGVGFKFTFVHKIQDLSYIVDLSATSERMNKKEVFSRGLLEAPPKLVTSVDLLFGEKYLKINL